MKRPMPKDPPPSAPSNIALYRCEDNEVVTDIIPHGRYVLAVCEAAKQAAHVTLTLNAYDQHVATIGRLTEALEAELAHHESKRQYKASWDAYHSERVDMIRAALQPSQERGK